MQLTLLLTTLLASTTLAAKYQCTSPDVLVCCQTIAGGALGLSTATGTNCQKPSGATSLQGPGTCSSSSNPVCCGVAGASGPPEVPATYTACGEPQPA